MQTRLWDFNEIDSTEFMNNVIAALTRKYAAGLPDSGTLRPGRLTGFWCTPNVSADNSINLERDGLTTQMAVTNDGVIVIEDTDLDDPITFGNVSAGPLPRIDLVVLKHAYAGSLPNTAARYIVIAGTPAANPVPAYENLAADETPLAEVWIDTAPGAGNPPVILESHIKTLPTSFDLLTSDTEPNQGTSALSGRTNNEYGDAGTWSRMGRNSDRFYIMRNPEDTDEVLLIVNAYYEPGDKQRCTNTDGACLTGTSFQSAAIDFKSAGVKPGDNLVITIGGNAGTYPVANIDEVGDPTGHTITITGPFVSSPTTGETFYVSSVGGAWYQEDYNKRSFCAVLSDADGSGNELFGIYKADKGDSSAVFGTFWNSILSSTENGDLIWPQLFAGQNKVNGMNYEWTTAAQVTINEGNVYNNGKFRALATPAVININNVYNAGTMTWGRAAGEPLSSGWWYLYATTDVATGVGFVLSKTFTNKITLQHPSNVDWRWVGCIWVDPGLTVERFLRTNEGRWTWISTRTNFSVPKNSVLQQVNFSNDLPYGQLTAEFNLWNKPNDKSVDVYVGHTNFGTSHEVQISDTYSSDDHRVYQSMCFQWPVNTSRRLYVRRVSSDSAYIKVVGFIENIHDPVT